ncbi:MAG: sulfotransferase [gamma proteobacterium symbiont of Clathrolucina costata]|uniref:Sulfotransferase n=1 Tax=Candidatus Thiodiazotropha taylori TaxID=2792791 RepID=A0A9E4NP61_9GAMM|nr:sulfotransferase [Candidatus Thiodiazotropha taylori]MCW4239014.1 sulfotransferase [Candidatus Thiodiazotropha endolucinida]
MSITLATIIYDDRSGSTYLSSLLNEMPCITVTLESSILTILARHGNDLRSREEVLRFLGILKEEQKFKNWQFNEIMQVNLLNSLSYPLSATNLLHKLLTIIFPDSTNCTNIVFIIKQVQIEYIDLIIGVVPGLKFILLYRDGRGVFASKKRSRHSIYDVPMAINPVSAAQKWRNILGAKGYIKDQNNILEVKYEELLVTKDKVIGNIIEFLFNETRVISHQDNYSAELDDNPNNNRYAQSIPASQRHLHKNVGKVANKDRAEAWKNELSSIEIWLYERTVSSLLKDHEYLLCNETAPKKIHLFFFFTHIKLREVTYSIRRNIILIKIMMRSPNTVIAKLLHKLQK